MTPLLRITDLHTVVTGRRHVVNAVDGVSLTVNAGEVLGIVGESGSGKTMTAMSILRLLPQGAAITHGSIEFDGRDLVSLSDREMRRVRGDDIGVVFQDPLSSLNPTMSIGAQIAEAVLLHRDVSRKKATERAVEVLGLVGLPHPRERINEYPHQLSGGMRQRVMIAIALACEPRLLIADEPTTALDVTIQKQILTLIDHLRDELRMAVILVTHDLGVIAGYADRVAVMYAGQIVESTSTEGLFARARHPYSIALFNALPERASVVGARLTTIPGSPPDLSSILVGCRFAPRCSNRKDRCTAEAPRLEAPDGEHYFACFYPADTALSDQTPTQLAAARREADATHALESQPIERPPIIELVNLTKEYPVTKGLLRREIGRVSAVAGVTLAVRRGETLGLVGESGCGKTTLGRLIAGLDTPTSGEVRFNGTDISSLRGADATGYRRGTQFMFQDSAAAMDPRMRVGAILQEPMVIQREGTPAERKRRVLGLLDEVGLTAATMNRYPHEFSGGQRQRIGLARALALTPDVIVTDEPVSALDVSIQAQVLNLMVDLQQRHGLTYVLISHDFSVVRYMADSIAVLYLGKLVEQGPAVAVHDTPLHPYTRALIDNVPIPDPVQERGRRQFTLSGELPSPMNPPSGCRFRTRCPRAVELCADQEPVLKVRSLNGHSVACHFPLDSATAAPPHSYDATTDHS